MTLLDMFFKNLCAVFVKERAHIFRPDSDPLDHYQLVILSHQITKGSTSCVTFKFLKHFNYTNTH